MDYSKAMDEAVKGFKAALDAYEYRDARAVVLEKGKTLLVKTSRAQVGKAIRNGGK